MGLFCGTVTRRNRVVNRLTNFFGRLYGGGVDAKRRASEQVIWGEHAPPPERRPIVAGLLEFELCGADLEHIRYDGVDVLRALRMVVRDRNWGTVPGEVERCAVTGRGDGRVIELRVRHRDAEVDFRWTGRVEAGPGRLSASFTGEAVREFARNRIGWCLLHPLRLAGRPVSVETPSGTRRDGAFPERISPHQPLRDIRTLRYSCDGVGVTIAFEGEVFETEDQRNWTDASYKTYGTPLDLPFPVTLRRGEQVGQRVTLDLTPDGDRTPRAAAGARGVRLAAGPARTDGAHVPAG